MYCVSCLLILYDFHTFLFSCTCNEDISNDKIESVRRISSMSVLQLISNFGLENNQG